MEQALPQPGDIKESSLLLPGVVFPRDNEAQATGVGELARDIESERVPLTVRRERVQVGWPGCWQAAQLSNWLDRSPATKSASGGRATRRAVMRMKPEQALKGKLWTPTRPEFGEGSTIWGSSRQTHLDRSTGVMGTARRDRGSRKRGRPVLGEGSGLNGAVGHRLERESDWVVVPMKLGNAGGGKDPDFWCAC